MKIKTGFDIDMDITSLINTERDVLVDELYEMMPLFQELAVSDYYMFNVESGILFAGQYKCIYKLKRNVWRQKIETRRDKNEESEIQK